MVKMTPNKLPNMIAILLSFIEFDEVVFTVKSIDNYDYT